jgi:4-hydroxybenzoyl-CoA thioesterase
MLINRRTIQIEWGDCDPAGTVFSPRYLEYGDACTNALFHLVGLFEPVMIKTYNIIGIPIVNLRARFVVPSDFGDELVYETCISEWGDAPASWRNTRSSGPMESSVSKSLKDACGSCA